VGLTRRFVAGCCNPAMALDPSKAHWLWMHRGRLEANFAGVECGVLTTNTPEPTTKDFLHFKGYPLCFLRLSILAEVAIFFPRRQVTLLVKDSSHCSLGREVGEQVSGGNLNLRIFRHDVHRH
jgi:hypothetical protein